MARARSCLIPETAGRAPRRFTLRAGASRRVVLKVFICNDFRILPDARLRPRGWGVCSSPGVSNGDEPRSACRPFLGFKVGSAATSDGQSLEREPG